MASEYCSGCLALGFALYAGNTGALSMDDAEEETTEAPACPLCFQPITNIVDEYNFECANCGFNDL